MLIVHQALRTTIADAAPADGTLAYDRLGSTIARTTTRDTIHCATTVLTQAGTDLTGRTGAALLDAVLPARRSRSSPRVAQRAISKHRATGTIDRTSYQTLITTHLLDAVDTSQEP